MDAAGTSDGDLKISFARRKNRNLRTKKSSSESEDEKDEHMNMLLQDAKELRKMRKRPNGVNAIGLALGKKLSSQEELASDDPFKLKTGGFIDMKALKRKKTGAEELDAVNLGSVFSAETNRRDEDADMMKYIEEELSKRKGASGIPEAKKEALKLADSSSIHDSEESVGSDGPLTAEDMLFEVPEHLRHPSTKKSEEMLSNQMLSGIPEVDLGIEERIRNIEATEEAKLQVLRDRMTKKEKSMSFVPTNMAVNFVQHNRFNIDDGDNLKKVKKEAVPVNKNPAPPVVPSSMTGVPKTKKGGKPEDEEKATDDFHFEKFKKQFRRF